MSKQMRVSDAQYEVLGDLLHHDPIIIPEETRQVADDLLTEVTLAITGGDTEYTIPEIVINDSYLKGGIIFNNDSGYLTLTPEKLYNNKTLVFYLITTPLPTKVEAIYDTDATVGLSAKFRDVLNPKLK